MISVLLFLQLVTGSTILTPTNTLQMASDGVVYMRIYQQMDQRPWSSPPRAIVFEKAADTLQLCEQDEQHCVSLGDVRKLIEKAGR